MPVAFIAHRNHTSSKRGECTKLYLASVLLTLLQSNPGHETESARLNFTPVGTDGTDTTFGTEHLPVADQFPRCRAIPHPPMPGSHLQLPNRDPPSGLSKARELSPLFFTSMTNRVYSQFTRGISRQSSRQKHGPETYPSVGLCLQARVSARRATTLVNSAQHCSQKREKNHTGDAPFLRHGASGHVTDAPLTHRWPTSGSVRLGTVPTSAPFGVAVLLGRESRLGNRGVSTRLYKRVWLLELFQLDRRVSSSPFLFGSIYSPEISQNTSLSFTPSLSLL